MPLLVLLGRFFHAPYKIKLKHFLTYMEHQTDKSPLCICDSDHGGLLGGYGTPAYFPDDLLSLVEERHRPPYRCPVLTRLSLLIAQAVSLDKGYRFKIVGFLGLSLQLSNRGLPEHEGGCCLFHG